MTFRSPKAGRSLLLPALFCCLAPTAAAAQWIADAAVGRAVYDPVNARVGAVNASLGLRYRGTGLRLHTSERWLYLSGGTDLGSAGLGWGAAGAGGRLSLLRGAAWELGVDAGADFYGYTASSYEVEVNGIRVTVDEQGDWGGTVGASPTLELRRGPVGVELKSGVVTTFGPVEGGEWLAVTALDGSAAVSAAVAPGVQVGAVGRYMRFPEGGYPYLGGSVQLARGPGTLWAFAGRWMSDSLASPRGGYGAGASVAVRRGLQVMGGWQQEPSDPLYLNAPRRTWSLRVSRTLGRTAPALPGLAPPAPADGSTTIRIPAAAVAEAPSVLGDFTGWQPVPMVRNGPFWELRLPIPPGIHHYAFRTAAGEVFVPDHLPSADDGMGGKSAVLVVQ